MTKIFTTILLVAVLALLPACKNADSKVNEVLSGESESAIATLEVMNTRVAATPIPTPQAAAPLSDTWGERTAAIVADVKATQREEIGSSLLLVAVVMFFALFLILVLNVLCRSRRNEDD